MERCIQKIRKENIMKRFIIFKFRFSFIITKSHKFITLHFF